MLWLEGLCDQMRLHAWAGMFLDMLLCEGKRIKRLCSVLGKGGIRNNNKWRLQCVAKWPMACVSFSFNQKITILFCFSNHNYLHVSDIMVPIDKPCQLVTIYIILLREIVQNQVTLKYHLVTSYIQGLNSYFYFIRYKKPPRICVFL